MRCCDCEFRQECRDADRVLTAFVRCYMRDKFLKEKKEKGKKEKWMTNADYMRSMTDDELAAYFMIFRPSDACFDDDEKNYISLNSRYFKHSQDCFVENLNWLQQLYTEDE